MAYFNYEYCWSCKAQTGHINGKCGNCASREALELNQKADKHWNSLSVDGKLDFLRGKIENLERGKADKENLY